MNRNQEFLDLFNRLEVLMKNRLGFREDENPAHAKLINQLADRDPVIAEHASRLHAYRSLRNSLVHLPGTGEPEPIAEPHVEVVDAFRKLVTYVEQPPTALETVAITGDLYHVGWNAPVLPALRFMLSNSFRLAPVLEDGLLDGIFTESTLWQAAEEQGVTVTEETTFEAFRPWCAFGEEMPLGIVLLEATASLHQVEQVFRQRFESNAFTTAILFTDGGMAHQLLRGLVTAHDLPSANPQARKKVLERMGSRL